MSKPTSEVFTRTWPDPFVSGGWSAPRYPTGLSALDKCVGGVGTAELWVVTSAPGQGRSMLATQMAVQLAIQRGIPTWLVANRDPAHVVSARVHAQIGRVPLAHLAEDRLTDRDQARLEQTTQRLEAAPLHLLAGDYAAHRFGEEADLGNRSGPLAVVFDDPAWQPGWDLQQAHRLAESGATVVVTLPRADVLLGDAFSCDLDPRLALADVVLEIRLHNLRAAGSQRGDEPGLAAIAVLRNRRGPHLTVHVLFQGHFARFVDEIG